MLVWCVVKGYRFERAFLIVDDCVAELVLGRPLVCPSDHPKPAMGTSCGALTGTRGGIQSSRHGQRPKAFLLGKELDYREHSRHAHMDRGDLDGFRD